MNKYLAEHRKQVRHSCSPPSPSEPRSALSLTLSGPAELLSPDVVLLWPRAPSPQSVSSNPEWHWREPPPSACAAAPQLQISVRFSLQAPWTYRQQSFTDRNCRRLKAIHLISCSEQCHLCIRTATRLEYKQERLASHDMISAEKHHSWSLTNWLVQSKVKHSSYARERKKQHWACILTSQCLCTSWGRLSSGPTRLLLETVGHPACSSQVLRCTSWASFGDSSLLVSEALGLLRT